MMVGVRRLRAVLKVRPLGACEIESGNVHA